MIIFRSDFDHFTHTTTSTAAGDLEDAEQHHPSLTNDEAFSVRRAVSVNVGFDNESAQRSEVHDGSASADRSDADTGEVPAAVNASIPSGDPEDEGLGTDEEFS